MINTGVEAFSKVGGCFGLAPFEPIIQPIIDDVLKEYQKDKYRKGTILKPCLLVWLCFALALRRDSNYNKTLNWLVAGFRWKFLDFKNKVVQDGTISHARSKIGVDVFCSIFNRLALTFIEVAHLDFHGLTTVMFDGTSLTAPDTESNRKKFGKHKAGRGYGAFPQMRVVALMSLSARRILDFAYAPYKGKKTGERTLMFEILKPIPVNEYRSFKRWEN